MANPEHVPQLDSLDRLTVRLYRAGLAVSAAGLLGTSLSYGWLDSWGGETLGWSRWLCSSGAALSLANVHLYDKRFRWFIPSFGWLGLVVQLAAGSLDADGAHAVRLFGLGLVFVALSALALKERFCFRLPGLGLVPLLLALSLIPMLQRASVPAGGLTLAAGLIYVALALGKARQPLHFDIGRKDMYQI